MTSNSRKTVKETNDKRVKKQIKNTYSLSNQQEYESYSKAIDDTNLVYKKTRVSIVIPVINEAKNLPFILPTIPKDCEVIMVDGHSTDGSLELAKKLLPYIRTLRQPGKGKGDAIRHGLKHAKGDIIVTFDADGSFGSNEIPNYINPLLNGYDLVKGSRFLPGGMTLDMPLVRRLGNYILTFVANTLFSTKFTDLVYGFHAFKKNSIQQLSLESDGFEIDTELYLRANKAGLKVTEVPSIENKRISGKSRLKSLKDGLRILKVILTERFRNHKPCLS